MPGFDGFSVVQGLMEVEPPLFVFVTAYSDHALKAFEADAVDYLMKPVEEDRASPTRSSACASAWPSEKRGAEEVEKLQAKCWPMHRPRSGGGDRPATALAMRCRRTGTRS